MKRFYKRTFLNKPRHESTGLILADAYLTDNELAADLTIGDCSRQVTLAFSVWVGREKIEPGDVANVRHKSAVLRKTVNEFLDAVEEGLQELENR
jgi:hypothetical protein